MKGLYKGKYLIAIYDKEDRLIDVACNVNELTHYKNSNTAWSIIGHVQRGSIKSDGIYLIDVTEKHNDIFSEEDELFLKWFNEERKPNNKEVCEKLGISQATYYNHKKNGTLYILENKLKRSDL